MNITYFRYIFDNLVLFYFDYIVNKKIMLKNATLYFFYLTDYPIFINFKILVNYYNSIFVMNQLLFKPKVAFVS